MNDILISSIPTKAKWNLAKLIIKLNKNLFEYSLQE